jgi:uncharacterized protein (UPF0276 family)
VNRPADLSPRAGLLYHPVLRNFLAESEDLLGYLEVIPDMVWVDRGTGTHPRYIDDASTLEFLEELAGKFPIVPHSIGLSIGSAHRFDTDHIDQIRQWHDQLNFPWHSDHLSYNVAEHQDEEINVGVSLPLPLDDDSLKLLVPRVAEVLDRVPTPFLLENNVNYLRPVEGEMHEADFLNELTRQSGCGLLLDLHNVYTNSRNHGFSSWELLERLHLETVIELHVAGGSEWQGVYLDAHSGPVPDAVWELLKWVVPRCPNVRGVTYELLGSWFPILGADRLRAELLHLNEILGGRPAVARAVP